MPSPVSKHNATQGKARQGKAGQDKARQGKARQGKARQDKARQGQARQGKARQSKASQAKPRESKATQGNPIQGKARQCIVRPTKKPTNFGPMRGVPKYGVGGRIRKKCSDGKVVVRDLKAACDLHFSIFHVLVSFRVPQNGEILFLKIFNSVS